MKTEKGRHCERCAQDFPHCLCNRCRRDGPGEDGSACCDKLRNGFRCGEFTECPGFAPERPEGGDAE